MPVNVRVNEAARLAVPSNALVDRQPYRPLGASVVRLAIRLKVGGATKVDPWQGSIDDSVDDWLGPLPW